MIRLRTHFGIKSQSKVLGSICGKREALKGYVGEEWQQRADTYEMRLMALN